MSQIGYMILGAGLGPAGYAFAIMHLLTHGFFKAGMFLGAGSVMHGMNDQVDMRRYGALRKFMPITFATFGLGYLAIIGVPPFAGFYSKDAIIETAFNAGGLKGILLGSTALLGAAITAFYMTRVMVLTFTSKERWEDDQHPHESPLLMWLPMAILAIGSVTTGFLFTRGHALVNWLTPVVGEHAEGEKMLLQPAVVSGLALLAVIIGVAIAIVKYQRSDIPTVAPQNVSVVTKFARKDLMQDSLNEALFMRPGQALTTLLAKGDEKVIDGAVRAVAGTALGAGTTLRKTQTGFARSYAALILIGAIALIAAIWVVTQ
jgi:NADH-quinone oxidoreductase subunit L